MKVVIPEHHITFNRIKIVPGDYAILITKQGSKKQFTYARVISMTKQGCQLSYLDAYYNTIETTFRKAIDIVGIDQSEVLPGHLDNTIPILPSHHKDWHS